MDEVHPPERTEAWAERVGVDTLITNAVILTMDASRRRFAAGAIAIHDGWIVDVGESDELASKYAARATLDAAGGIVHPGFIDAHVHLSQHLGRSTIPDSWPESREHDQWLPYWLNITEEDAHYSALLGALEMAHNGTTTFCDLGARFRAEINAAAAESVGLRGFVAEMCWDRPPHDSVAVGDTDACLRRLERQLGSLPKSSGRRVIAGVGIAGMGQCSDDLLMGASRLAQEHGVPFYFHQSFAPEDASAYEIAVGGRTAVEHFAQLRILGPHLALVHMNRTEPVELRLLQETMTAVVHCPAASLRAAIGASQFGQFPGMVDLGITVALGSDSGNYSDAFDVGRQAYLAATIHGEARRQRAIITAATAFEMATIGGARALGLEAEIGSLEVGKRADIVIRDYASPGLRPGLDPMLTLVYSGLASSIRTVLVDGRPVLFDGQVTTVDELEAYHEIDAAARRLYQRMAVPGLP